MPPHPDDVPREWLSLVDETEERTWLFDLTFLTSAWRCIYGAGCPGIDAEADPDAMLGCCHHGAYLGDDEDESLVAARSAELEPHEWQLRDEATAEGGALFTDDDGNRRTRIVDGACVMLNRPGHPAGAGCALHQAAEARGADIADWKPSVCWQAPLRREDLVDANGHVWSTIRSWYRRDWGEGGADFGWWCIEEPEAFVATDPVYVHAAAELRRLSTDAVYDQLRAMLDRRRGEVWLPHPARRRPVRA